MKKLLFPLLVAVLIYGIQQYQATEPHYVPGTASQYEATPTAAKWQPGEQVRGSGRVTRILSDDNEGSRHQRFILEVSTGRTLLIAHNIDLAPRVRSLSVGDTVTFYGEYEPNDRGGVVHWTHHDPSGRHVPGWLLHNGETYQ